MKYCKIKKQIVKKDVYVVEVLMSRKKCVPPKKLITKVNKIPIPESAIFKFEDLNTNASN